jgi:hypothetical protein
MIKLYAIVNDQDEYFMDIGPCFSTFHPLCLIENKERAKHIFNVYLTPEEKETSSIVVFYLAKAPKKFIIDDKGNTKEVY